MHCSGLSHTGDDKENKDAKDGESKLKDVFCSVIKVGPLLQHTQLKLSPLQSRGSLMFLQHSPMMNSPFLPTMIWASTLTSMMTSQWMSLEPIHHRLSW